VIFNSTRLIKNANVGSAQIYANFHLKIDELCDSGWGTDEQAVITVLAHRNVNQRKQILMEYEQKYNESLIQRLRSELSGDFEVLPSQLLSLVCIFFLYELFARSTNNDSCVK
jgi:hypothetical protein